MIKCKNKAAAIRTAKTLSIFSEEKDSEQWGVLRHKNKWYVSENEEGYWSTLLKATDEHRVWVETVYEDGEPTSRSFGYPKYQMPP